MNRWVEAVYEHSPVALQHAMISLYGLKLVRLRYGGAYRKYLEDLLRSQRFSKQELDELQNEKLRALITHCYENVPYYARLFRELKFTPADFRKAEDLAKLPILTKETVRSQPELFHARNYRDVPCEIVSTSGTTGTTLRLRVDAEGRRKNYAFFSRLKIWAGVNPDCRTATFAGRTIVPAEVTRPPFWRYNLAANTILFSSYHLSQENIPAYLAKLCEWQPELIDSYPSSLESLARFVRASGGRLPKPKAIITSSETLREDQREIVSKMFAVPIFDHYGSAEQVCFISQCEAGSYHVHPEFGVTEFVPLADSGPDGGFRVVATGFTNNAMPLLRYDMGDTAIPGRAACRCGRHFPTVECIIGRTDDIIITASGRRIGRLDPVFKGLQTIRKAQIVQETLERIRVRVVPGAGFSPNDLESVRHELEKRSGRECELVFETVAEIPVGPNGKFQAVISRVPRPR